MGRFILKLLLKVDISKCVDSIKVGADFLLNYSFLRGGCGFMSQVVGQLHCIPSAGGLSRVAEMLLRLVCGLMEALHPISFTWEGCESDGID